MTSTLAPGDLDRSRALNGALVLRRLNETDGASTAQRTMTAVRHEWAVSRLGTVRAAVEDAVARRSRALAQVSRQYLDVIALELKITTPLAIGFGGGGAAVETSLTVHPTYGCPYLPASGLKGAAKAASTESAPDPIVTRAVFGARAVETTTGVDVDVDDEGGVIGGVRFIDALPVGPLTVERAVLTPHYQPYYAGTEIGGEPAQPAAYHQPVPVEFITVTAGTFLTAVVGADRSLVKLAVDWLTAAAQDRGLGAKTASGFGYFTATVTEVGSP